MSSIRRRTEHAGQTTITLTGLHAHFDHARQVLMQVSARLQAWAKEIAEQLLGSTVWLCVCEQLKQTIAAVGPPKYPPLLAVSESNCGFQDKPTAHTSTGLSWCQPYGRFSRACFRGRSGVLNSEPGLGEWGNPSRKDRGRTGPLRMADTKKAVWTTLPFAGK